MTFIDVRDRLIKCQYYGCDKVLGFTVFQGHNFRVKSNLNEYLVRTVWDHTQTYCHSCYEKVKGKEIKIKTREEEEAEDLEALK